MPLPSLSETLQARTSESGAGLKINSPAKGPKASPPAAPVVEKPASARMTRAADARVVIDKTQSPSDRAEADYRKGVAAYKRGHMAEAATQFRAALHEDPRHLAARQTLLAMLAGQKQWDDAEVLLKEGLQLMPTQTAWAMALARIEVERGDLAAAWGTLQQYAASAGNDADYQGFAGVLLARLHQPHDAASHYQAALRLRPREGRWWLGLGLALEADGHAAEAQQAYRRAQTAEGLSPEMKAFVLKKLQ
ncbi:beta-barrel assembly-enhancing protease [mine drainage metagenome]|uniref:Beta-barrel assembly-enhancing protease n=1 Tax=mine drainage metagenome TaxID=410659 RepID=A0A1J5SFJ9_9ZZZZ